MPKLIINHEESTWTLQVEAVACDDRLGHVLVAGCYGPATAIKAAAAGLRSKTGFVSFTISGVPGWATTYKLASPYGYRVHQHLLGLDTWHLLAIARTPGLVTSCHEEAVWRCLRSTEFTTPLLRSWMPWLSVKLVEHELLRKVASFNCEAAVLALDSDGLDALVTEGIQAGVLKLAA